MSKISTVYQKNDELLLPPAPAPCFVSWLLQPLGPNHTSDQGLTSEVSDIAVATKSRLASHRVPHGPRIVHRTRFSNTRSPARASDGEKAQGQVKDAVGRQ